MILRDVGIFIIALAALIGALSVGYTKYADEKDGPAEEFAELMLEKSAERLFGLDDDQLRGLVDFSIYSPEDDGDD